MVNKGLEERVLSHDKQLVRIETVMERVANNQDSMTDSMLSMSRSLDKLANIQDNSAESFKRIHERIDDTDKILADYKSETKEKFHMLDPIFTILRYPKATLFSILGLYLLAISDIRTLILSFIKLF